MAETLLAILLVTKSANGCNIVHRWPAVPENRPRLCRSRPSRVFSSPLALDNPWRATHTTDTSPMDSLDAVLEDNDYNWSSRYFSGSQTSASLSSDHSAANDPLDTTFGFPSEKLASLLCPDAALCHQKFELIVDDLAFISHPVCALSDPQSSTYWQFRTDVTYFAMRGRGQRNRQISQNNGISQTAGEQSNNAPDINSTGTRSVWLQNFQLTFVLDLPDPSSSNSGNVWQYFDIIYEQLSFNVTAVLFQEQVTGNFVEKECDMLSKLRDGISSRGDPFEDYMEKALQTSSIAAAMKDIYEAVISRSIARISLNGIPVELQLPPYLDSLLHIDENDNFEFYETHNDDDDAQNWGPDMQFGWHLPSLRPWKSILLLEKEDVDQYSNVMRTAVGVDDQPLLESLHKFFETAASATLSLADISSLLDWDLETQTYPVVRWLVHHRRAKVVDVVHQGLKTVYTLPPKFDKPFSELTQEFDRDFSAQPVTPLPEILSAISHAPSKQRDNHFFATVVRQKELIPLYHDVVLWMLRRGMLIRLSLRIRIVATRELKERVKQARVRRKSQKSYEHDNGGGRYDWLSHSNFATRSLSSGDSAGNGLSSSALDDDDALDMDDDEDTRYLNHSDSALSHVDNDCTASLISDPGQATRQQRYWLKAMSDTVEPRIATRFNNINQYFDGKKTDDEILFRADISRKQLREVLHRYDEYLQTFLHP
ncbi:hypothetical protein FISHEDRAFT_52427 [Fistulina hepatica ATCC 64428]|nr:hypothetical protein FISHEDRAFT_52427 [Fistulina hepatica ATCC 64428]